jgi:hypothetical protein
MKIIHYVIIGIVLYAFFFGKTKGDNTNIEEERERSNNFLFYGIYQTDEELRPFDTCLGIIILVIIMFFLLSR